MAKKNALISSVYDDSTLVVTVNGAGEITVNLAALSDDIRHRAMVHGLTQKISDAAAISKALLPTDETEAAQTKFAAMEAVANRIIEGDWKKAAGEGAGPVAGLIFRAFAEYVADVAKAKKATAPTAEKIRAVYDAKTRADQLALRNVPAIATIIDRMKSERGPVVAVDTDSLLGELGL